MSRKKRKKTQLAANKEELIQSQHFCFPLKMAALLHKVALIVYQRRQQLHLDSTLIDSTAFVSNETDRPFKGFSAKA